MGSRDKSRGAAAAAELAAHGPTVQSLVLDVHDSQSILQTAAMIESRYGRLDILVNNAGILLELGFPAPSEVTLDDVRATFEVNTFGAIAVMSAMLPLLRRSDAGRIVNVSSRWGSLTLASDLDSPGLTLLAYNASKAALNAATLQYARELRDTPIKINLADPMHCATDINNMSGSRSPAQGAEIIIALALLGDDGPSGTFTNDDGPLPW